MSPSWYIFSRLYVNRHNNFMCKVSAGLSPILDKLGKPYTLRGRYAYFENTDVVHRVLPSHASFIESNGPSIIRSIDEFTSTFPLYSSNVISEFELFILEQQLGVRLGAKITTYR